MKKKYIIPVTLVDEADVQNMMAVSLMDGQADANADVLTRENTSWNIWSEDE